MNKVRTDIKNIGRVEWNSIELRMQEQIQVVTAIQHQDSYCHSKWPQKWVLRLWSWWQHSKTSGKQTYFDPTHSYVRWKICIWRIQNTTLNLYNIYTLPPIFTKHRAPSDFRHKSWLCQAWNHFCISCEPFQMPTFCSRYSYKWNPLKEILAFRNTKCLMGPN